jgi:hypothetical protein
MAINIKNRAAAAQTRVNAFIEELAAMHSAEITKDFATALADQNVQWDALKEELLPTPKPDDVKELLKQALFATMGTPDQIIAKALANGTR